MTNIEQELHAFAKKELEIEGLRFEFVAGLSGAFSNKAGLVKLPILETDDALDVLKSLVVHEACHLRYSDFDYAFDETTKGLLLPALIIEDIVVERNMAENRPHVIEYLKRLNSKYVYKYFIRNKDYASMNVDDLCLRKFFTIFSRTEHCPMDVVRYSVSAEKKAKAQEKFMKLRAHIPEAFRLDTRPRTTQESEDLARKIIDFFGDFERPSYYFGQ